MVDYKRYRFVDGNGMQKGIKDTNSLLDAIQSAIEFECEVIDTHTLDGKQIVFSTWDGWNVDWDFYKKDIADFILAEIKVKENFTNNINFTYEELQLLYAACMSYGDKLSNIIKEIPNELVAINGIGQIHGLSGRSEDAWNIARKITEYMEE